MDNEVRLCIVCLYACEAGILRNGVCIYCIDRRKGQCPMPQLDLSEKSTHVYSAHKSGGYAKIGLHKSVAA